VGAPTAVTGRVELQGRANHSGVEVHAAGLSTLTAADGSFALALPPGAHVVTATHALYLDSRTTFVTSDATLPTVRLLGGDGNGSGAVELADLVLVAYHYGSEPPTDTRADINASGRVDLTDLAMVGVNYSKMNYQPWTATGQNAAESGAGQSKRRAAPQLVVEAPTTVSAGEEFVAVVRVAGARGVAGVDLTLAFAPDIAAAQTVTPLVEASGRPAWLDPARSFVARADVDPTRGVTHFAAIRLGDSDAPDDGVVAVVRFRVLRDGNPRLALVRAELVDREGSALTLSVR
jgi:hypothetical protein